MGQTLLVLVGLPGSGKSTLSRQFQEQGWQVVCQDDLGNRKACETACWRALAAGHSVVVDRCNFDMAQRRHWVQIAQQVQQQGQGPIRLLALCLELPVQLCLQRAVARGEHATLPASQAPEVIKRFTQDQQFPRRREGFDAILLAKSSQQAQALATQLLTQQEQQAAVEAAVEAAVPAAPPAAAAAQVRTLRGGLNALQSDAPPFHQPQQQQQQQRRHASAARADAAHSWRQPSPDGAGAEQQHELYQQRQVGQAAPVGPQPASSPHQQRLDSGSFAGSPLQGAGRQCEPEPAGSIVAFPGQHHQQQQQQNAAHQKPRRHPWQRHGPEEASGTPLDAAPSPKVVVMFDANGCVTSHTSMRKTSGLHQARPGTHHLRRLKAHYLLGMYSSASKQTVNAALLLLEAAAGPGAEPLFERGLVLCRTHTMLASAAHVAAGGKEWDTVKPLRPYFSRLHRTILVDDDSFKACAGEESNLLLMPCWQDDDPSDTMMEHLVAVLLQLAEALGDDPDADVRQHTAGASAQLQALAAKAAAAADDDEMRS